ncbi:MAG: cobyrinate a,c-diamide synthase [Lachnospiraceae bacterium]|nr:cobyrinate a,c-diamide synthase [Lachnospiraceae bacterium]
MAQNRVLLCAPKSGSGKTMITCGIITLLKKKGLNVAAFKCGPDYIDPMFHRQVLGVPSGNLDTYFTEPETLRYLLKQKAEKADITVIEGVMGYYDGLGGVEPEASAYDVSRVTKTPTILVIDGKGSSLSLTAIVKGFKEFKEDSNIQGVILNRTNGMIYERLKDVILQETGVKPLGYVPEIKDLEVPSRHLGLVAPEEIKSFQTWSETLADAMGDTLDIDGIIALSKEAPLVEGKSPELPKLSYSAGQEKVKVGVAFDAAFSFYYTENFELMEQMGAEIVRFSPIEDQEIPKGVSALMFGGGYPEIYAKELSDNTSMLQSIRAAIQAGMPCIAECGGFMYLNQSLEDAEGVKHSLVGALSGDAYPVNKLSRFGYIEATAEKDGLLAKKGEKIRGHEFHYWDCTENGEAFTAAKPVGKRSWQCIFQTETLEAGFPHFYFYNHPEMLFRYLEAAKTYGIGQNTAPQTDTNNTDTQGETL